MNYSGQEKYLDNAISQVWKAIETTCEHYCSQDSRIEFNRCENAFRKTFKETYYGIKKTFMKNRVQELDRHKLISTLIVSCIECQILTCSQLKKYEVFMGLYMVAVEVGLNWMLTGLNEELDNIGVHPIERYTMPIAFACSTPYFEIFSRNLYYAKEKGKGLNPLDISEKLFLIEYITLLDNNIAPELLKNT